MLRQVWLSGLLGGLVRADFRSNIVILISRVDKVVLKTVRLGSPEGQKCDLYGRYETFRPVGTYRNPQEVDPAKSKSRVCGKTFD